VHLVDDLAFEVRSLPRVVGPGKGPRVDDFGRTVRSLRLISRRRIRIQRVVVVQLEAVPIAGRRVDRAAEITAVLAIERRVLAGPGDDLDTVDARSPHAKMDRPGIDGLGANRQASAKRGRHR
jgi:hypothetical protein